MRLRNRSGLKQPEIIIVPMIDIMFFLLVFFIMSTLYMVDLKTFAVDTPQAVNSVVQPIVSCTISMEKDGSLLLDGRPVSRDELLGDAMRQQKDNSKFSVVICADQDLDYGKVIELLDDLKGEGIADISLATDGDP